MTTSTFLRSAGVLVAGAALTLMTATSAQAQTVVSLEHDASGTTHIASTNSDVALGPTTLHTDLDIDTGDFAGSLPLPGTTSTFTLAGFLPVTADVDFIEHAPLQGHIDLIGINAVVTSTAEYHVRLSNIKVAGFPTFTGPFCRTVDPISIPADTPDGEGFDLLNGGRLVGTYTIGAFQHCGFNTWLINAVIPGAGNTLDIEVSNGRFVN